MKTKVKICGITNLDDALIAQKSGADALGFVFYPQSPRYIRPSAAKKIIFKLPKKIKKIGVFVNPTSRTVKRIAQLCTLDILQFHGDEPPRFCQKFRGHKTIKAFRIKDAVSLSRVGDYSTDYYLFDTFKKNSFGGTGKRFAWGLLNRSRIKKPFFLSGGLDSGNIVCAVKTARPDWVDVSSGVELSPGKKDKELIQEFIARVKTL